MRSLSAKIHKKMLQYVKKLQNIGTGLKVVSQGKGCVNSPPPPRLGYRDIF